MKELKLQRIGRKDIMKIINPFILHETSQVRKIFMAEVAEKSDGESVFRGHLIHQKKNRRNEWVDIKDATLNDVKNGEAIRYTLDHETLSELLRCLQQLEAVAKYGIKGFPTSLVVHEPNELLRLQRERFDRIKALTEEEWREILESDSSFATRKAEERILADRKKVLGIFEENINLEQQEGWWQEFFMKHQWIFGYGLRYHSLGIEYDQPVYRGEGVDRRGKERGDYLAATNGDLKYSVLVEIKKPQTRFFNYKGGELKYYRNGVPELSSELVGAINQVLVNSRDWEIEGQRLEQNQEEMRKRGITTIRPRGIVVIGHQRELAGQKEEVIRAFELYRQSIANVDLLTFDELLVRAKQIVGYIN